MTFSYTSEITFETARFDADAFFALAKEHGIPVRTERLINRNYFILPVEDEGETDFTTVHLNYNSKMSGAINGLMKLIPKPYQVTSGDDLEGEWKETTTVVEATE